MHVIMTRGPQTEAPDFCLINETAPYIFPNSAGFIK